MPAHADLVGRYKELRAKARPISNALAKSLGKDVIGDVARKLGMLNGKEILLETEDEIVVLMDTGIFDIRRDGENAVERFLRERPPAEGTDERLILETMRSAWHSIFQVQSAERGVGVQFLDVLRDEERFVWDIGFSHTAQPGALMAARLYSPGEITMTTGAALPVYPELVKELPPKLAPCLDPGAGLLDLSDPQTASDVAITLIAAYVRSGASASIRYEETRNVAQVARQLNAGHSPPRLSGKVKVGRNDPCPCGSGKKYKKCCGS